MEATELRDNIYDHLSEEVADEGFVGLQGQDRIVVIQQEGEHYVISVAPLFPDS